MSSLVKRGSCHAPLCCFLMKKDNFSLYLHHPLFVMHLLCTWNLDGYTRHWSAPAWKGNMKAQIRSTWEWYYCKKSFFVHLPLYVLDFFTEFLKADQSTFLLTTKISSFFGRWVVENPLFVSYCLAGTLLFDLKALCKPSSEPVWEIPNHPSNVKSMVPTFFRYIIPTV